MSWRSELVDRQVAAFNAHDVDAFCACYRDDAVIGDGEGNAAMTGVAQIRAGYSDLFERRPEVAAEIAGRLEAGEWVVDRETVRLGEDEVGAVIAYRVRADGIDRVVQLD